MPVLPALHSQSKFYKEIKTELKINIGVVDSSASCSSITVVEPSVVWAFVSSNGVVVVVVVVVEVIVVATVVVVFLILVVVDVLLFGIEVDCFVVSFKTMYFMFSITLSMMLLCSSVI